MLLKSSLPSLTCQIRGIFNMHMRLARPPCVFLLSTYMGRKSWVIYSDSAVENMSVRGLKVQLCSKTLLQLMFLYLVQGEFPGLSMPPTALGVTVRSQEEGSCLFIGLHVIQAFNILTNQRNKLTPKKQNQPNPTHQATKQTKPTRNRRPSRVFFRRHLASME